MKVLVFCNESSGRSLSDDALRDLVRLAGHTVADIVTTFDDDTRPRGGVDLLVAAGGDGTVASVAAVSARWSIPMAILPLGTANNIAASLGMGRDVPALVSGWERARPVPLDLGRARSGTKEWTVVEGVGGGFIPAGIAAADRILEPSDAHPVVEVATAVEVFRTLLDTLEPAPVTLVIDGAAISEPLLMFEILNMPSIGPKLVLAPDASPSDGMFDVVVAREEDRDELRRYLDARLLDRDDGLSLPTRRARHVRIERCEELHIDDERIDARGYDAIDVTIEPGAATVLV